MRKTGIGTTAALAIAGIAAALALTFGQAPVRAQNAAPPSWMIPGSPDRSQGRGGAHDLWLNE